MAAMTARVMLTSPPGARPGRSIARSGAFAAVVEHDPEKRAPLSDEDHAPTNHPIDAVAQL